MKPPPRRRPTAFRLFLEIRLRAFSRCISFACPEHGQIAARLADEGHPLADAAAAAAAAAEARGARIKELRDTLEQLRQAEQVLDADRRLHQATMATNGAI